MNIIYGSPEPPCVEIYFRDEKMFASFFLGALIRHEEKMSFGSKKLHFSFFSVRALGQGS